MTPIRCIEYTMILSKKYATHRLLNTIAEYGFAKGFVNGLRDKFLFYSIRL